MNRNTYNANRPNNMNRNSTSQPYQEQHRQNSQAVQSQPVHGLDLAEIAMMQRYPERYVRNQQNSQFLQTQQPPTAGVLASVANPLYAQGYRWNQQTPEVVPTFQHVPNRGVADPQTFTQNSTSQPYPQELRPTPQGLQSHPDPVHGFDIVGVVMNRLHRERARFLMNQKNSQALSAHQPLTQTFSQNRTSQPDPQELRPTPQGLPSQAEYGFSGDFAGLGDGDGTQPFLGSSGSQAHLVSNDSQQNARQQIRSDALAAQNPRHKKRRILKNRTLQNRRAMRRRIAPNRENPVALQRSSIVSTSERLPIPATLPVERPTLATSQVNRGTFRDCAHPPSMQRSAGISASGNFHSSAVDRALPTQATGQINPLENHQPNSDHQIASANLAEANAPHVPNHAEEPVAHAQDSELSEFAEAAKNGAEEERNERIKIGRNDTFTNGVNIIKVLSLSSVRHRADRILPGGGCSVRAACYMIGSLSDLELNTLLEDVRPYNQRGERLSAVEKVLEGKTKKALQKLNPQGTAQLSDLQFKRPVARICEHATDILTAYGSRQMKQKIAGLQNASKEKDELIKELALIIYYLRREGGGNRQT